MSIQIESDLAKILERIEGKIDNLQKDVGDLKVSSAKLESKLPHA
ncbi:hypothetical protein [Hydrococcus rivularis]|nr:hypothetical protein [Hydrococcus rivularis]